MPLGNTSACFTGLPFHHPAVLTVDIAFFDGFAFVIILFTLAQRYDNFDVLAFVE